MHTDAQHRAQLTSSGNSGTDVVRFHPAGHAFAGYGSKPWPFAGFLRSLPQGPCGPDPLLPAIRRPTSADPPDSASLATTWLTECPAGSIQPLDADLFSVWVVMATSGLQRLIGDEDRPHARILSVVAAVFCDRRPEWSVQSKNAYSWESETSFAALDLRAQGKLKIGLAIGLLALATAGVSADENEHPSGDKSTIQKVDDYLHGG